MVAGEKKVIPVKEGLWTTPSSPDGQPQLIGSRCLHCGELYFPKKVRGVCANCQQESLEDVRLSRRGKIHSFSVVMQQPGGGYYKGPVPYAYGCVDLPEGVRIVSLLTESDPEKLEIDMDVEMVVEKLCDDDEGNVITTFKFKPVKNNLGKEA
ncbi:MAG: OB-fold domain-containing protein [Chloroflexi bacterium]|nr:OB-fold domain-containing protein [Chloroflexota bacterium]